MSSIDIEALRKRIAAVREDGFDRFSIELTELSALVDRAEAAAGAVPEGTVALYARLLEEKMLNDRVRGIEQAPSYYIGDAINRVLAAAPPAQGLPAAPDDPDDDPAFCAWIKDYRITESQKWLAWGAWCAAKYSAPPVAAPDDALDAKRHRYTRATTTAIRDPETGERIEITPEMYDAAIDRAMARDPDAKLGIKSKDIPAAAPSEPVARHPALKAADHAKLEDGELAAFEAWWEDHGQFCRAGGGDYEKTFAYRAWQARGQQAGDGEPVSVERIEALVEESLKLPNLATTTFTLTPLQIAFIAGKLATPPAQDAGKGE